MSNDSSAAISAVRRDWVSEHREMYLRSGGAEGHIMDITAVGGRNSATHCMVKYKGRKSGKIFITALCYADIGGEVVICASEGGADHHPDWYLNLDAEPHVRVQVKGDVFDAVARTAEGAERDRLWNEAVKVWPQYADYQTLTDRKIPVVVLERAGG